MCPAPIAVLWCYICCAPSPATRISRLLTEFARPALFSPKVSSWFISSKLVLLCPSLDSQQHTMAAPSGPLWLDVNQSPYSNNGNAVASVFFLSIIAASLTCCLAISWKTQRFIPFSLVLSITCILEIIAYALRLQEWYIVSYTTNFGLSVIAPVFLTIG